MPPAAAEELVRLLLGLYGDGLSHIMDALAAEGAAGGAVSDRLLADPLVESLLLCMTCTRWTWMRGSSVRSTASGPTSDHTPAACSTSVSAPTGWRACGWRAAATAARRPR